MKRINARKERRRPRREEGYSSFPVERGLGTFGLPQRDEGAEVAEIEESPESG